MGRQGAMMSALDKWRGDDALSIERRLMNEALAKLGETPMRPKARGHGRLLFGLDLTGSREPSLRNARVATAAMFDALKTIGAIAVKLIYYRGTKECRASDWHDDPLALSRTMQTLGCESGETQIARVLLSRARRERTNRWGCLRRGSQRRQRR
jgi:hypothetical protein